MYELGTRRMTVERVGHGTRTGSFAQLVKHRLDRGEGPSVAGQQLAARTPKTALIVGATVGEALRVEVRNRDDEAVGVGQLCPALAIAFRVTAVAVDDEDDRRRCRHQRREMRRAFYAGAWAMLMMTIAQGEDDVSLEEGASMLHRLKGELELFALMNSGGIE